MPKHRWLAHTASWMKEIKRYNVHAARLKPRRACLLVIDMQNEFLEEFGAIFFHYAAEIVPNVKRIGLLTPRVRERFEQLGILQYEGLPSAIDDAEVA